jgi:uncharacterized membrane protein
MANRNKPTKRPPQQHVTQSITSFRGPLPPPEVLGQYEQLQPGFADRILRLTESEATHRRKLENNTLRANVWLNVAGLVCGLLSVLGVIWLCQYAFNLGFGTKQR